MATSPRPEVEGDDDDDDDGEEEEVKATAGRTSFSFSPSPPSTAATDESVAKSTAVGSKGCTAVARSTTRGRRTLFSMREVTRVFKGGRDDSGIAARWGERLAFTAAVVVRISSRGERTLVKKIKSNWRKGAEREQQRALHTLALFL